MKLLLICKTPIIIKIFSLICKKLNIQMIVQEHNSVEEKFDIIVVDSEYVDDRFNIIKQFSSKIGAICSEDLSFDKSRDFIIPRPFLPLQLQETLDDVIKSIEEDLNQKKIEERKRNLPKDEDSYMDSIANFIAQDIDNDNDESIVSYAKLKEGGVLDSKELGKIQGLLKTEQESETEMNEEDWLDLSQIIDKALNEVKDYEFDLNENDNEKKDTNDKITLVLSKFTMDELKPLLTKLDQNSIDKLTTGGSINLELKLKEEL